MNIAVNAASVLHVRLYLFCRQVAILLLMENAYVDVCQRGLVLIPQVVALLHTLRISPAMASQWAVGAALALCVACEHECSRLPSSPALATALGDLLYLARRHAKSLDLCGSSEWYPLQSPQGLDEITQRAAVQYGRAGRVRLASFLAAQRHASWKCADDHDQPSPLLAQLNQYERDQWWDLMHDTVVRFMKAELQRGNVCDVVDVALRWLKLDAAVDYASSTVRALFLQALAAPSNDPDGWRNGEWSTVFDPSATSTTVRLQVSLKNALRVDFSVDDVVVTCEYEGLEDEEDVVDCLSLDAPALMGQHRPAGVLRSSTSDMMDTIDGFTSYLAEGDMRPHDGHSPHPSKTADNDIAVTFGKIALPAQRGATADAMREHVPYGRYTCRQVAVRLADDVVLVVPLEDPVTFTLRPSYSSTMALDVRCPPILSPLTSTQCTVMIRPHGDIIQGGTLAVTIQGDAHVEISVASSTYARPNDSGGGGSVVVPLPSPCQVDTAFEFTLVSTSNKEECSHVVLDVAVHASITTKDGIAHKRTSRHAETHISVTPLVTTTTTTRCIRDTVHCVDIEIQANDKVGVEIDPAQYEWWALDHLHGGDAHDKEGHLVNLLSSDTPRYPGLLIMANPNTSLPVMTLNPSGRCHAAFVVDVTDELPSDTAVYMRLHCKSVWTADDSTVGTLDNPFPPLEMVTVVPMDVNLRLADLVFPRPFQLTTTCADLSTASTRSRWTTFSVDVVAPPSHSSQLWIGLDETSQRCWVCAGPSVQTVTSSSKAAFKLRPLHVGRLSFPVFTLKVRDSDNSVRIVAPNLVHHRRNQKYKVAMSPTGRTLLILSSVASVLVITLVDIAGGLAHNSKIGTNQYNAPTVPRYLKMHISNRSRQLQEVATAAAANHRILYIEPSSSDQLEYAIAYTNCTSHGGYLDSDIIYTDGYMLPLLQRILDGMGSSSINLVATPLTHVVWIDCGYDGRRFQDTSTFKAYVVDIHMTQMTSFALVTMNAWRSRINMEVQVGAVIVSTANLSQFALGSNGKYGVVYAGTSKYHTLVAIDFPYEHDTPFHDTIADGVLPTNQYLWRLKSTNESLAINGYSGNQDDQGSFVRYVLGMSDDPVRDFAEEFFSSLGHSKDSWAWVQGLVIAFVCVRTWFRLAVAVNVAFVTWLGRPLGDRWWLPDVFAGRVRHLVVARAVLILVTFAINHFWSLHEWMFTKAFARYKLTPMFSLGDGVRSDFLVLFLTWTEVVASLLNVPMAPIVPIVVYLVCYEYSQVLVAALVSTSMEHAVRAVINDMYIRNLVNFSPTGMNLWTRYRLTGDDPPSWLFATEFIWFFAPCLGMVGLLLAYKCVLLVVTFPRAVVDADISAVATVPADQLHTIATVPLGFLDHFVSASPMRGLVSVRPMPFQFEATAFQVDKSNLWRAGGVLLDSQFLVCIDDLPRIFLNVVAGATLVKIYCCAVVLDPETRKLFLLPRLVPLYTGDLSLRSLFWLRLDTLWVKKVLVGENLSTSRRMPETYKPDKGSSIWHYSNGDLIRTVVVTPEAGPRPQDIRPRTNGK
ncbi:hypothetical protein DYB38_000592 [Aphanomyces astaci]|uniref:Uncharacterized protein n=1 Tax=Aphanomyces astaci TaxID=112090 RepID=A0A397CRB4_APHAT|nr:hypothetical protein DYB38_000592 [Aphanomyces astaci]